MYGIHFQAYLKIFVCLCFFVVIFFCFVFCRCMKFKLKGEKKVNIWNVFNESDNKKKLNFRQYFQSSWKKTCFGRFDRIHRFQSSYRSLPLFQFFKNSLPSALGIKFFRVIFNMIECDCFECFKSMLQTSTINCTSIETYYVEKIRDFMGILFTKTRFKLLMLKQTFDEAHDSQAWEQQIRQ